MLTPPTVADLAAFTGRAEAGYTAFAPTALAQAALLLSLITGLSDYPDDETLNQLARNAIMEMADRVYLEQPYAQIISGPFQAETIGSYSYSKSSSVYKASTGLRMGLLWWDLAVLLLSVGTATNITSGAIHLIEPAIHARVDDTTDRFILGPADAALLAHADNAGADQAL